MKSDSNLEKVLESGAFAVTAEIGPPKGADADRVRSLAAAMRGAADAYNITDCQTAIVRMSSTSGSIIALQEGLEPVMQMTCRDRNRIAMQSDVLGAAALGVQNVLAITGDHQSSGNEKQAKNVFDLDSIQEIVMLKTMRDEKRILGGDELTVAPRLFIGAVENPFADPAPYRVRRLGKKIRAGADFIQTQCIYDLDRFAAFMDEARSAGYDKKVHILGGVTPLKSAKVAKIMKKFVPGITIPDAVVTRMENAENPKEEGIAICVETIETLKKMNGVHGVHIMAIAWEEKVPEIVQKAELGPRPTL